MHYDGKILGGGTREHDLNVKHGVWLDRERAPGAASIGYAIGPDSVATQPKTPELISEIDRLEKSLHNLMEQVHTTGHCLEPVMVPVNEACGQTANPEPPVANELCGRIRSLAGMADGAAQKLVGYRSRLVV